MAEDQNNQDQNESFDPGTWNEFDWERNLRDSDDYARRYFQLLGRFSDLPGVVELINTYLGRGEGDGDCSFDCDHCDERWSCDLSLANEWNFGLEMGWDDDDAEAGEEADDEDDEDLEDDDGEEGQPGHYYFYETDKRFKLLRQVAIGWCNIYAAILPPDARRTGLKVLFHLGRALGNLSYSIGDGLYEYSEASVAFAKRSLSHLNLALGLVQKLTRDKPRLAPLLGSMGRHILKSREVIFEHLQKCRE